MVREAHHERDVVALRMKRTGGGVRQKAGAKAVVAKFVRLLAAVIGRLYDW